MAPEIETKVRFKLGPATRDAFGEELARLGGEDAAIVVVDADVSNSTRTEGFGKAFPDRFFQVGIAESNLVGVAAGLAASGKKPWIASFACFVMCKMGIEDVALACALPGFTVVVPADAPSTRAAVRALHGLPGPGYLRLGRPKVPVVYEDESLLAGFAIGRAQRLRDGDDVTILANGMMIAAALEAAEELAERGLSARVLDVHTVKPIDVEALARAAEETGALVVAEEHLAAGGLGAQVAAALAATAPAPIEFVNLGDRYAESGKPDELFEKYGLTARHIARAAERAVGRKA
jgi:transketolase